MQGQFDTDALNSAEPIEARDVTVNRDWNSDSDTHGGHSTPANLQPSGVLNNEAMRGKFSLRNVLGVAESEPAGEDSATIMEDPIRHGLINFAIANSLFERFVKHVV
jgi:hypothetical protein